jgi:hypothetical protein
MSDRLDITGARWSLTGAEAVLRLRSLWASGDWDTGALRVCPTHKTSSFVRPLQVSWPYFCQGWTLAGAPCTPESHGDRDNTLILRGCLWDKRVMLPWDTYWTYYIGREKDWLYGSCYEENTACIKPKLTLVKWNTRRSKVAAPGENISPVREANFLTR